MRVRGEGVERGAWFCEDVLEAEMVPTKVTIPGRFPPVCLLTCVSGGHALHKQESAHLSLKWGCFEDGHDSCWAEHSKAMLQAREGLGEEIHA